MDELSGAQKANIDTFSNEHAVNDVYDREGFSKLERIIVDEHFKKKGRVLDLGCGAGRTTVDFYKEGYDVVGIDLSPEMIQLATKKYPKIDFRVMNACELDFKNESFDYVLFSFNGIDFIHPFEQRVQCLTEVYRVLKKGGIFAYTFHNACALPKTREALLVFLKNIVNLRIFSKYRLENSPSGILATYYGSQRNERDTLKNIGFGNIQSVVKKKAGIQWIKPFFQWSVCFVAEKI